MGHRRVRLTRRDVLLLVVIWGLVAVLLTGAFVVLRSSQNREASAPAGVPLPGITAATPTLAAIYTPIATDLTARSLYALAEEKARGWREDAQLVSCRGSWESTAVNLIGRPVEWTYRFYSAQARLLYFVIVAPDGRVNAVQHVRPVTQPPPRVPIESWQTDSPAALANWLNIGGGQFLGSHAGSDVMAQLSVRSAPVQRPGTTAGAEPAWLVVGYDRAANEFLSVTVKARNGETAIVGQQ